MRPLRAIVTTAAVLAVATGLSACGGGGSKSSGSTSTTAASGASYKLLKSGVLRVGTLTDAPPNVYLKDGRFTGFDNDLLTAVAAKIGLKVDFAGTDFSALLSQVATHKFDVGSSSITITEARKKTALFTNGYDFGYLGLDVPAGSALKSFDELKGKRVVVVQGTVQDDFATGHGFDPVRVPDYNSALNQLKTKTAEAWISPAEIGEKTAKDSDGKVVLVSKQLSPTPTAFAVAKDNPALAAALNKGLDQVIADGTWTRLEQQYFPGRQIPAGFKPGSGSVALPE